MNNESINAINYLDWYFREDGGADKYAVKAYIKLKENVFKLSLIADTEPVNHGWWIPINRYNPSWSEMQIAQNKCSICGAEVLIPTNHCPNCGAIMYKDK